MPPVKLADADAGFAESLRTALGYPLRGAGLATCVVLALIHYVALLPSYIGVLAGALVWAATWRYAADCLLHTANGYADPPNVASEGSGTSGWALTAVHLLLVAMCVLAIVFWPHLLWPVLIVATVVLPAIDMSLAFDGNLALALNPLNWLQIMGRFGIAYLLPVAINLLLGLIIVLASVTSAMLPRLLALPLFAFTYTWLIVLAFHLMGSMIHQRHEQFGMTPEAPTLAQAGHQGADGALLDEVETLAQTDPAAATGLLVARLRERSAPAPVHLAYRHLLQRQDLRDALLVHGQIWIAALIAEGQPRRALGVLQECRGIEANFIPDDPHTCGELADLAARLGMSRLALQLCRGFMATWPKDAQFSHYVLQAARLLGEHAEQRSEALVLLDQLGGDPHAQTSALEVASLRQRLTGPA